jgi:hypothetical protein
MRFRFLRLVLWAALGSMMLAGCWQSYQDIPPNYIGMKLTPTGYEDTIYTPGQVDIGTTSQSGQGNQLVLIQRSGVEIKEQFLGKDGNKDGADHRCLTQDQNPMTLDVRLVLALPDYSTPPGKKDLKTLFMLGNPTPMQGNGRIWCSRRSRSTSSRHSSRSAVISARSARSTRISPPPSKLSAMKKTI